LASLYEAMKAGSPFDILAFMRS